MSGFQINKKGIAQMAAEIQQEFDKHPITVPVGMDSSVGVATTVYNGPVIMGNANGATLAWDKGSISQTSSSTNTITPGYEGLATSVVEILKGLPSVGLPADEQSEAEAVANEILVEVTDQAPDKSKLRRLTATLKGFLASIALGISAGVSDGAKVGAADFAKTALEQLGHHL